MQYEIQDQLDELIISQFKNNNFLKNINLI